MRILFVDDDNTGPSLVAERLTAAWLQQALGPLATTARVRSSGIDAPEGQPMDRHSASALERLGGDAGACAARQLRTEEPDGADLVLTMTRRQRHVLLKSSPRAMRKTFTVLEASDLLAVADLVGVHDLPLGERASTLALRLNAARTRRPASAADDIEDPAGQPARVHDAVARQLAAGLHPVIRTLVAPATTAAPARV